MGLDFQRASAQEVAEHDLAVRMNPVLRNLPGDAEGRRSEIEQVLEAQPRLIVDRQYGDLREMLQQFEIVDAEGNPCNGGVHLPEADSVVECFSTDKLKLGVTQHFRCPTLLLVPNTRFLSLVQAIDNHRISGQNDTLLLDSFREEDGRSDTIEGWRPMIVDGARGALAQERLGAGHTKPIDYVRSKWKQRMQVSEDLCGIDRHAYAMLIMISMKDAQSVDDLIDRNGATILDGDPLLDLDPHAERGIPVGQYRKNEPGFRHEDAFSFYASRGFIGGNYGGHWMRNAVSGESISS